MDVNCVLNKVMRLLYSEVSVLSESFDDNGVVSEWLVDVVGVRDVPSSLDLLGRLVSLGKQFLSGHDVLLQHLAEEDVVDLDVMCRHPVVQETGWEHHVVPVEPKVGAVLVVESVLVSLVLESASGDDHCSAPEVAEQGGVVQRSVAETCQESASNWSGGSVDMEDLHPEVVDDLEGSEESVLTVLSSSHLDALEESSDEAWSSGESFVDQVLEATCVFENPVLESLGHFLKFN